MKARNTVLSVVFCLLLLGPTALFVGQEKMHLDLPGWLTAKNATYLSGGIEKADIRKHLSLDGFASKELQTSLETAVGNFIPFKASALLDNSSLQRSAIQASNILFNYSVYPTFFGSKTAYSPSANALLAFPKTDETYLETISKTASGIAEVARRHPEKNFYLVVSDISDSTEANPIAPLLSKRALTTRDFVSSMEKELNETPNVHAVSVTYSDMETYYDNYYTTDHHWNGFGTFATYKALAPVAKLDPAVATYSETISFGDYVTNGAYAREGLMLLNETITEPKFDLTGLEVQNKKVPPIASENSVAKLKKLGLKAAYSFYPQWYGTASQTAKSPLVNTLLPNGDKAVVIMDSYADSLHWLLAQNYSYLRCYRDIRDGQSGSETLEERISEVDAQDIYFVGSAFAYCRIPRNYPNYFN